MWQVAEMALERRKSRDDCSAHPKCRDGIRDARFGVRDYFENCSAELLKRGTFGLLQRGEVPVDLNCGHANSIGRPSERFNASADLYTDWPLWRSLPRRRAPRLETPRRFRAIW